MRCLRNVLLITTWLWGNVSPLPAWHMKAQQQDINMLSGSPFDDEPGHHMYRALEEDLQAAAAAAVAAASADVEGLQLLGKRHRMHALLAALPKAELHVHLEGTLEVEMMFDFADRNNLPPPYPSVDDAKKAYDFKDLQSFLDLYYKGCAVLLTSQDFYDLAKAYFLRAHSQGVAHVELFFDPQTHLDRGISFNIFFEPIAKAAEEARSELGMGVHLIMCFLRHLSEDSATKALLLSVPYLPKITGVGLDSSEAGRPPSLFKEVFQAAKALGLHAVAHAGEEGPAGYVWEALKDLGVERVDHGIHSMDDPSLVAYLEVRRIGLTLCPLSNLRLKVFQDDKDAREHLAELIKGTSMVTMLNSDDPAYFGGYLLENYIWVQELLYLDVQQVVTLVQNSFMASFLSPEEKQAYFIQIEDVMQDFKRAGVLPG